ncbi:MAG: hypothetical protein B6U95_00255 [Thermofilum sp. ex4484_82]|nr:MAG: hypothetical protein B6U95_00255 [Thermofilum sp. ex4484_82]OYT40162.1 MAG: hypothetical protein B6U96_00255 [Archaeoglobales archaeon ex4484_92]
MWRFYGKIHILTIIAYLILKRCGWMNMGKKDVIIRTDTLGVRHPPMTRYPIKKRGKGIQEVFSDLVKEVEDKEKARKLLKDVIIKIRRMNDLRSWRVSENSYKEVIREVVSSLLEGKNESSKERITKCVLEFLGVLNRFYREVLSLGVIEEKILERVQKRCDVTNIAYQLNIFKNDVERILEKLYRRNLVIQRRKTTDPVKFYMGLLTGKAVEERVYELTYLGHETLRKSRELSLLLQKL